MKQQTRSAGMNSANRTTALSYLLAGLQLPGGKKPLDENQYPKARDSRGSAGRQEIRKTTARVNAPRQTRRAAGRK
jgi:hypothetical protein